MTFDTQERFKDKAKAGLIPFYVDENQTIRYLVMTAANPKFGGYKPMISKGSIEDGEEPFETAIREAVEELGLCVDHLIGPPICIADRMYIELRTVEYEITVFAQRMSQMNTYDLVAGDETKSTHWMTLDEFLQSGRQDHQEFIQQVEQIIESNPDVFMTPL